MGLFVVKSNGTTSAGLFSDFHRFVLSRICMGCSSWYFGKELKDDGWIEEFDRIIPMPGIALHRKRGNNQSTLFTGGLMQC